jgi:hypothetical protein
MLGEWRCVAFAALTLVNFHRKLRIRATAAAALDLWRPYLHAAASRL